MVAMLCFVGHVRASLTHTFMSANAAPPVSAANYTASGTATLTLGFAPTPGTSLTVVENTGLPFISGSFTNLAHGNDIALTFGGQSYNFVANYYGGTGNDLVLEWATTRPVSWGYNAYSQLGNGSTADSNVPSMVLNTGLLSSKTVLSMTTGYTHSIAVCADGSVATWGYGGHGNLGNGSLADSAVPVALDMSLALMCKKVIAVAAGAYHSVALASDGTVTSWGYYCLGDGTSGLSSVPVKVSLSGPLANRKVVAIAAGEFHSLALCSDGRVVTWGWNAHGQLGNGTTNDSPVPVLVGGALANKTVIGIAGGDLHSLVVCSDGTAYAWGNGTFGQLGNGGVTNSSVPVAVSPIGSAPSKTVVAVSAGQDHSLVLCSDGTMFSWGANNYGQLGNGNTTGSNAAVPVVMSGALAGKTVVSISALAWSSLAQCSDGSIFTWGYGGVGALGNGSNVNASTPSLVSGGLLSPGSRFLKASAGSTALHGAALMASVTPVPGTVDPLNLNIVGSWVTSCVVQPDGKTVIVGSFTSVGGLPRNNIARINVDGTVDTSFDPNVTGTVTLCTIQPHSTGNDFSLIIGGSFTHVGNQPRQYLARLDSTGAVTTFNPTPNDVPQCILVQRTGEILVGGRFTYIGSTPRAHLAQFDGITGALTTFNPGANNWIDSMVEEASGDIIVGGRFTIIGSSPRNYLARLSPAGVVSALFNPNPNNMVFCVALQPDQRILVGGYFTAFNSTPRTHAARLEANGTLEPTFAPDLTIPSTTANNWPLTINVQTDGKILVGGWFTTTNPSITRNRIARYNGDGTLDTFFDPNANHNVSNVSLQADGKIWLSGNFTSLQPPGSGPVARSLLARLHNSPAQQILSVPNTALVNWTRLGSGPELEQVRFDYSTNGGSTWLPAGNGTRVPGTGWTLSLSTALPSTAMLRARGRTTGHYENGSSGIIEQVICYDAPPPPPDILVKNDNLGNAIESCMGPNPTPPVNYGSQVVNTSNSQTFTICNSGLTPLVLGAITVTPSTDFTLSGYTPGTLASNQCTTFTITFKPTAMGPTNATVKIVNNDPDASESPFCFYLKGVGVCPEINVDFPFGTHLTDGTSVATIGTSVPTCTCVWQTFYITNLGTSDLHLAGAYIDGPNQAEFSVTQPNPSTVTPPNGVAQVDVLFCPLTNGAKTATLHILSDDGNESSFDIKLKASAVGPEIQVQQVAPLQTLTHNATLDLGCTLLGTDITRNFKITNVGNPSLFVTGVTGVPATQFGIGTLSGIPGAVSTAGSTFNVRFYANALGTFTGTISIANNDCDESPFLINVVAHCVSSLDPAFTSQPANKIVYVGAPVSFSAGIDVCAPATVKWYKGLTTLSTTALTQGSTTTTYSIPSAALSHGGLYYSRATPGTATTNNANLTVVSPAVQCINKLAGQSITMTIQATSGNPMTYTWLKDGQLVSPQPNGPSLTLNNLTAANAGQFICQVQVPGSGMLPAGAINLSINGLYPMHSTIAGRYIAILDRGPNNDNLGGRIDITIQTNGCCVVTLRRGAAPAVTVIGAVSTTPNGGTYGSIKFPSIMGEVNFTIDPYLNPNRFMNDGIFGVSNLITPQGTSNFTGWRNVWGTNLAGAATSKYATSATVPGPYTMGLFSVAPGVPQGDGFASFSVLSNGTYSLSGETPIGDVFTTSNAFIGPDGDLAIFHVLPGGTGSIVGISRIALNNAANATDNEIVASSSYAPGITWSRIANVSPTLYPAGFAPVAVSVLGGYYGTAQVITSGSHPLNFLYAGLPSFYSPNRVVPVTTAASYSLPGLPTLPTTLTFGGTGAFNRAFISGKFEVIDTNPIAPCGPLLHRTPRSLANVQPFYRGIVVPMNQGAGRIGVGYFLLDQLPTTANTSAPKVTLSGAAVLQ